MSNSEETDKKTMEQAVKTEPPAANPQGTASASSEKPSPKTASTNASTVATDKPMPAADADAKPAAVEGEPSPKRIRLSGEAKIEAASLGEEGKPKAAETVATQEDEANSDDKENNNGGEEIFDVCLKLGLKGGERLEVEWQLEEPASEANGGRPKLVNKWWGCKLMPHDGKTEDSVAVRQLEYDPYPEGGFPESSVEEVIFLSHEIIMAPDTQAEFKFRPEGVIQFNNEEETREAINGILMTTLDKHSGAWKQLDRAQQARIADGIAQKKELLVEAIMNHSKSAVIGGEDMKEILQGIMQKQK